LNWQRENQQRFHLKNQITVQTNGATSESKKFPLDLWIVVINLIMITHQCVLFHGRMIVNNPIHPGFRYVPFGRQEINHIAQPKQMRWPHALMPKELLYAPKRINVPLRVPVLGIIYGMSIGDEDDTCSRLV
jgi:hypothetical protein